MFLQIHFYFELYLANGNSYKLGYFEYFSSNLFDDEILHAFFESNNVTPTWIEMIYLGSYDYETDNGTGSMPVVRDSNILLKKINR